MTALTCFYPRCGRGLANGHAIYRINAKGVPGIWACKEHRANTDAPVDPVTDEIVETIESAKAR